MLDFSYSTLEGFVLDVLAILEELRIELCIFVGHSLSAMVGAVASITRPELLTKIVMLAASPEKRDAPSSMNLVYIVPRI